MLHLLDQGLAKTTVRLHRDNLWTLGGELIRRRYDDDELARQDVKDALRQLIEDDGGSLIWPRITESEQGALDAPCKGRNGARAGLECLQVLDVGASTAALPGVADSCTVHWARTQAPAQGSP